jgi:hypothetical protein
LASTGEAPGKDLVASAASPTLQPESTAVDQPQPAQTSATPAAMMTVPAQRRKEMRSCST